MPDLTANTHTELFLKAIAEGSTTPEGLVPENHLELWLQQIMEMGGVSGNYVRYTEQELSAAEEAQARDNIGAAGMEDLAPVYDSTIPYKVGNLLTYLGKQYYCIADAPAGTLPTNTTYFGEKSVADIIEMIKNGSIQVGSAKEAESIKTSVGVTDETPFSAETAGGDSDISTGYQNLNKLVGCKVVKNQQAKAISGTKWASGSSSKGTVAINDGELTYTVITPGSGYDNGFYSSSGINGVNGHIYMVFGVFKASRSGIKFGYDIYNITDFGSFATLTTSYAFYAKLFTANASSNGSSMMYFCTRDASTVEGGDTISTKGICLVDLTLRYGSNDVVNAIIGSDSSKYVENLLAFDPNILKDTDYDTGSFSECKSASLESVEYNQWDEEWRNGLLAETGVIVEGTRVCPRNLIPVIGGKTISFAFGNSLGNVGRYALFDSNRNLILYNGSSANTINLPINCAYITFCTNADYGSTYKNDISVFYYWDGSRIGYEPYKKHSYPMPNVDLNGILKVVNGKVVADGDELTPDGSGNGKNYSPILDLADLTWTNVTGTLYKATVPYEADFTNTDTKVDMHCTNYMPSYSSYLSSRVGEIAFYDATEIRVNTGSASMPTGKFFYKLKTPTTISADTFSRNVYMDDFGFISFLDEDGNVIDGLQGNEILYKANVSGFAESLYVRADGDPEFFAEAEDLTDEALNARGYYKMQVLLSPITDAAGLTYDIEEAMKIGNLVSLTIRATNLEETSISSGDPLFTLASDLIPAGTIKAYANVAGSVVSCTISNLGSVSVDAAIAQNETVAIILTYAV